METNTTFIINAFCTIQSGGTKYLNIQIMAVQCKVYMTVQYYKVKHITVHFSTIHYNEVHNSALQCRADK